MKENDKNNSLNEPFHDLYENSQEQKIFISMNVYSKSKDEKLESN